MYIITKQIDIQNIIKPEYSTIFLKLISKEICQHTNLKITTTQKNVKNLANPFKYKIDELL